ncbi:MAG: hypothetical protein RIQ60_3966 [Pseudomonadota bacterium]
MALPVPSVPPADSPVPLADVSASEMSRPWVATPSAAVDTGERREPWMERPPAAPSYLPAVVEKSTTIDEDLSKQHWDETVVDLALGLGDDVASAHPNDAHPGSDIDPSELARPFAADANGAAAGRSGEQEPSPVAMTGGDVHAAGPVTQPGFLRDAERKARWQRPWVRAVLTVVCLLLGVLAMLQTGVRNRDRYAARWPATRPVLAEMCNLLGCTLQAPRLLDALVVETSSLTRPPGVDGLRLLVVLRNRVEYEVAAPHVELTLTDAAGVVAVRRIFNPGEFGVTRAVLGGQQDANWSLVFNTPLRNIAGYTVAVFYP